MCWETDNWRTFMLIEVVDFGLVVASIFAKSLSVGCCFEIAEAWKRRNKIVEACCCSSRLLHFFEKSLIERVAFIVDRLIIVSSVATAKLFRV